MRVSLSVFLEKAVGLAWSLWRELGVPGVAERRHADAVVDLEPLILFTASLGDADARLRDAAREWCAANGHLISRTRLENLRGGFVAAAAGGWLREVAGRPCDLSAPSLVRLKLRALFGVGLRAEILWIYLDDELSERSAASLAAETGFSKRSVSAALDMLARAGLLEVARDRNQHVYRLHDAGRLRSFAGDLPDRRPAWVPALRAVAYLRRALEATAGESACFRVVALGAAIDRIEPDLRAAGIRRPGTLIGELIQEGYEPWAIEVVDGLLGP